MRIRTGTELRQELRESRLLPTGCASLDGELLRGGLREGHVIEICGGPGSGKTQLCIAAAAHAALRGERVLWLDAGAAFSAARLLELVTALRPGIDPAAVLEGVLVAPVRDAHQLLDALAGCLGGWSNGRAGIQGNTSPRTGLLVCDPLHTVCATLTAGGQQHSTGAAVMAALGVELKRAAAVLRCPVLVTNSWVPGGGGRAGRPGLGRAWASVPHARLHLRAPDGGGPDPSAAQTPVDDRHAACVLSATYVPRSRNALFRIQPQGCIAVSG